MILSVWKLLAEKFYSKLGNNRRRTSRPAIIEDEHAVDREFQDENSHADDCCLTHDSGMSRIHAPKSRKRRFTSL